MNFMKVLINFFHSMIVVMLTIKMIKIFNKLLNTLLKNTQKINFL